MDTKIKHITFPSIKNVSQTKFKEYTNQEFENELVVVEHKLDGANFQIIFTKTKNTDEILVHYGSRNMLIFENQKFVNFGATFKLEKYSSMIERIKMWLKKSDNMEFRIFGELYGISQNRIKYFSPPLPHNMWKAFGLMLDQKFVSPKKFYSICDELNIDRVECIKITNFAEAIQIDLYNKELIKSLVPYDEIIEGVVIKIYDWEIEPTIPYLKIKTSKFQEKENGNLKIGRQEQPSIEPLVKPKESTCPLRPYLTEARLCNVLGNMANANKISDIYNAFVTDAIKDFNEETQKTNTSDIVDNYLKIETFMRIKSFLKNRNQTI